MPNDWFDFNSVSEESERLDYKNLVVCPHCKKPIPADSTNCLYCGETVCFCQSRGWIGWVAAILILILVFFSLAIFK